MNRRKQPEVYDLLYQLGVTANYIGFFHTAYAVSLCVEQPDRLLLVTKWLYPEVAKQYGTNWKAVERNIRTVSCIIWREGRPLLEELAHRHLEQKPRNAQMLAILASSLDTGPLAVHGLGEAAALPEEDDDVGVVDEPVKDDNPIVLSLHDYELFSFLAAQPGTVFSREELMTNVWGYTDYLGDVSLVNVSIHRLRAEIEDDPSNPQFIMTRRGSGYYFEIS